MKLKEDDYRFFFEHVNEGLIVLTEGKIVDINASASKILNSSKAELIGKTIPIIARENKTTFGDLEQMWKESKNEALKKGYSLFEWPIYQKNHPTQWIGASLTHTTKDNKSFLLVFLRDISQFKLSQIQVSEELREKNALINNTDDLIWSLDREKKLRSCNNAFLERIEKDTGRKLKPGDLIMSPEYEGQALTIWQSYYQRAFEGEVIKTTNNLTVNGISFYSEISLHPIYDQDQIIGISCFSKDVTQKTEALLTLQESENKYRKNLERITSSYIAFDNDWNCTYINKKGADIFSKKPEELIGKNLYTDFSEDEIEPGDFHRALHEAKETGKFVYQEDYYAPWDFWFANFIYPDENGVSVFFHDITKQKRAEEKLNTQESILSKIYDSTSDGMGIYEVTEKGEFVLVSLNHTSRAFFQRMGVQAEEYYGVELKENLIKSRNRTLEDALLKEKKFQEVVATKKPVEFSTSGKIGDNKEFHSESTLNPIIDDAGKCSYVLWVISDVTEHVNMRVQLAKELSEKDALINNNDDIIWSIDSDMKLVSFNDKFSNRTAKHSNHKVQKGDLAVTKDYGEALYSKWTKYFERALKGEKYKIRETKNTNENPIHVETSFHPIHEGGKIIGVSCCTKDVTEMTEALLKVQASEKKYRQYQERITTAYIALDNEWNIRFLNQKGSEIFGRNQEDLLGKNIWEEIPEAVDTSFYHVYQKAQEKGKFTKYEALFEPWDKWFSTYLYPDSDGISVFFHDITEQKKTELQLKEHESLLAKLYDSTSEGLAIFQVTEKNKFVLFSINETLTKIFQGLGLQITDYYGMELDRIIKETNILKKEEVALVKKRFEKVVETIQPVHSLTTLSTNGIELHLESAYNPIGDESGKCSHILCVVRDVTEQISMRLQLANELTEKNALINNTDDLIWSIDKDLKLRSCNDAFLQVVERDIGKKLNPGDTLLSLAYEEAYAETWKRYYESALGGKVVKSTDRAEFNGRVVYSDISLHPIYDQGQIIGVSCFSKDITLRTETLFNLQASEKKYRQNLERINSSYLALDNEWRCTYINNKAANTWKKHPEDLIGKVFWEEISDAIGGDFYQALHKAKETGEFIYQEEYYAPWDTWFADFIYPDDEGVSVFFHDITEQKKAENQLYEQESLLAKIFDSTTDGMSLYKVTDTGEFLLVSVNLISKVTYQKRGLPVEDYYGIELKKILTEATNRSLEEAKEIEQHFKEVAKTKSPTEHHSTFKQGENAYSYTETTFNPIVDGSGKCSHVLLVIRDVTEQKNASLRLATELREKNALINNTEDLIWSIDSEMRLMSYNQPLIDRLEKYLKHPLNKGDSMVIPELGKTGAKKWEKYYKKALKGTQFMILDKGLEKGTMVYAETTFNPIEENGKIVGVSCFSKDVTEKTVALLELQASEKKYRQYQDRITSAYMALDNEMNVTFINQKGEEILGKNPGELIGKNLWEEVPEGINTGFYDMVQDTKRLHEFTQYEEYIEPWDKWFSSFVYPDEEGTSIFFHDITEQKKTEHQLKEQESLFGKVFESTNDGMGIYEIMDDGTFVFLSANHIIDQLFQQGGHTVKDFSGMEMKEVMMKGFRFSKEEALEREKDYRQVAKTQRPIHRSKTFISKDKSVHEFLMTYNPILDETGKCTHLLIVIRNVTQEKAREKKIAESQQQLNLIYNSASEIMVLLRCEDAETYFFESANQPFFKMVRLLDPLVNPESMINILVDKNFLKKIPNSIMSKDFHKIFSAINLSKKRKEIIQVEVNPVHDNKVYSFEFSITPIIDKNDEVSHLLIVIYDRTDKLFEAEQTYIAINKAEENERTRIAMELHDSLTQTLSVASMNLKNLVYDFNGLDDQQKYQKAIQYLDLGIEESRSIAHRIMPKSIRDFGLIPSIKELIENTAPYYNEEIQFTYNKTVRFSDEIELNLFRIVQQALSNSLTHAQAKHINILLNIQPAQVYIHMYDDGIGFEPNNLPGLKNGIGMRTMRSRAIQLGGIINVESQINEGTHIYATIPLI